MKEKIMVLGLMYFFSLIIAPVCFARTTGRILGEDYSFIIAFVISTMWFIWDNDVDNKH